MDPPSNRPIITGAPLQKQCRWVSVSRPFQETKCLHLQVWSTQKEYPEYLRCDDFAKKHICISKKQTQRLMRHEMWQEMHWKPRECIPMENTLALVICIMILNTVRQHNCFIIQGSYIGHMFRLIDRSSSGLFSRLSHKVLCTHWDPSVFTSM